MEIRLTCGRFLYESKRQNRRCQQTTELVIKLWAALTPEDAASPTKPWVCHLVMVWKERDLVRIWDALAAAIDRGRTEDVNRQD